MAGHKKILFEGQTIPTKSTKSVVRKNISIPKSNFWKCAPAISNLLFSMTKTEQNNTRKVNTGYIYVLIKQNKK